jgi:UDP-N-acetyl-2-amino-2-deoxyglucuronate dehydrogenase
MNETELLCLMRVGKDIPFPKDIIFEPTFRCNMRCKMCFYSEGHFSGSKEMSLEQIQTCINNLPATIRRVVLIGGEPLCHPAIVDICKLFAERSIRISINTNGYLLKPDMIDKLRPLGLVEKIAVSLDGVPAVHNSIRGLKNAFERTFENLLYASEFFNIHVVTVYQDENENNISELMPYLRQLQNVSFSVEIARKYSQKNIDDTQSRFSYLSRENIHLKACEDLGKCGDMDAIAASLKNIEINARRLGFNFHFIPPGAISSLPKLISFNSCAPDESYFCSRLYKARLDPQGNLIHCYALRMPMGSLIEHKFEKIWNGEIYKRFRRDMLQNGLPPICTNCFACQKKEDKTIVSSVRSSLKVGIIGCGKIADEYAKEISKLSDCDLIGVTSRDFERGVKFAENNGTKAFSLKDLVAQSNALILATEPDTHFQLLKQVVDLGAKNILIEKPLAVSIDDCRNIVSLKHQYPEVKMGVSSQMRYSPLHLAIQDALRKGRIGVPLWFSIECNYNRREGYYSNGNGWRRQTGGNVLFNQGIHVFDFLLNAFGMPEIVSCAGSRVRHREVPFDRVKILFRYSDGFYGDVTVTTAASTGVPLLVFNIAGANGTINVSTDWIKDFIKPIDGRWSLPDELKISQTNRDILIKNTLAFSAKFAAAVINRVDRRRDIVIDSKNPFEFWRKVKTKLAIPSFRFSDNYIRYRRSIPVHDLKPQLADYFESIVDNKIFERTVYDGYQAAVIAMAAQKSIVENREVSLTEISSNMAADDCL